MSDSKNIRVHVLVTDGQITRTILAVAHTTNHIIFAYPVHGQDRHVTYHMDGCVLERIGPRGPIFRKQRYSALDDFKGDAPHFGAFLNIDKPSTWGSAPIRRTAKNVTIDLRPCMGKTNVVSVHAPLLVPGDLEPVNFYRNNFNILECEVFTETIPWFAIIGYYSG